VLGEPEQLNWYRGLGEHWKNKFKHVVRIVHNNYFVYAQEQPAAFVRLRFIVIPKFAKEEFVGKSCFQFKVCIISVKK